MVDFPDVVHGLIIETDKYAGNFEREMCAHITGVVGECEVGDKEAQAMIADTGNSLDYIFQLSDDRGTQRPVTITSTDICPRGEALLIFTDRELGEEEVEFFKERAQEYADKHSIKILGYKKYIAIVTTTLTTV